MQILKIRIKPQVSRLDSFVATKIKALTRSKAKKLINQGFITVNSSQTDPSYNLKKGDSIRVEVPLEKEVSLRPEKIPLDIVYEDDSLLVINKQASLVVHPTLDHPGGTLVNALLSYLGSNLAKNGSLRPGVVHRLDKDTSGLLVVAKSSRALEKLKEQFQGRRVHKTYIALVHGQVTKETGTISGAIERHPRFKTKFVVAESGKSAVTDYKVLERFGDRFTLLELYPQTGRTHQLRVHLAHIGHPIVGDKLYGGKMLLGRQFLHSKELTFTHPKTNETVTFTSELPDDLKQFLRKLKET